jgi:type VI secretion system secreted protein VgrG
MLPTKRLPVTFKSPLPAESKPLLVHWATGHEELGRLSEFEVELYSEDHHVPFDKLLGKPATVCLSKLGGNRFWNGIITRLVRVGSTDRFLIFRAVLSPKLWLLTRTKGCRIHQYKTVPEVVKLLLREHAIPFVEKLQADAYRKWDYITQYRESDFAFISRLLEQEGIYYYFKHTLDNHELVLSDSVGSHEAVKSYETVPVRPPGSAKIEGDHFSGWRPVHQVQSARVVLQDHDFRLRKGADIKVVKGAASEHEQDEFEIYDYPGEYVIGENKEDADAGASRHAGEHYALARLDEQRAELEVVEGEGNARGVEVGALFKIDSPEDAKNQWLVTATRHELRNADFQTGGQVAEHDVCHLSFAGINSKRQFRPARITEKPLVAGPQTAIVVGKSGEEIWTDKYGRVKVQFHWDRKGGNNEESSCWVRVGQIWAGANWGGIHIPRMGQEVIVQFLEGDPDRPIITGSVYNIDNMPPYTLPANATQSGIKSRSTKGGTPGNFNELRFEDKKGSEQVYLQAEKDQDIMVKNNETHHVGVDRTKTIGGNETVTVTGNRTETVNQSENITVKQSQTISVTGGRTITVGASQTETIGAAFAETVVAAKALSIGAAYQVSVGAAMNETVIGGKIEEIGGGKIVAVGLVSMEKVKGNKSVSAANISETAKKDVNIEGGQNVHIHAVKNLNVAADENWGAKGGKKAQVEGGEELTLKSGKATITLRQNGDILFNGNKIQVTASGDFKVKGSKCAQN